MHTGLTKTRLLICAAIIWLGMDAQAQKGPDYESISTAQGLSQGLVNDMLQDKEGFIWIATKGGLNRYDGYSFKIFTTDPQDTSSISSNSVSNLLEDSKGRIWIGTYDGGVNVYDKKTGRFLRIVQKAGNSLGLSSNRIESAMIELPDGRILVCAQGGSLHIISLSGNGAGQLSIKSLQAPGNRKVLGIGKDDKEYIWVGCTDNRIFIFNPSTFSFDLLSDGHTFTSLIEKTGSRLTARFGQPFLLKPEPTIDIAFQDSTGQLAAEAISRGAKGEVIIADLFALTTNRAGSLLYDGRSLKAGSGLADLRGYVLKSSVKSQSVKCMLLDRSGVLWLGMLGHGLYKYRISSDRFNPGFPKLSLQRIAIFNKDIIYVQGWRSIQTATAEGTPCANPLKSVVGNAPPTNVLQAQNGDYWTYDLERKTMFRYTAGLQLVATYLQPVNPTPTEQLQPLIEDSRHRIWVCGANGTLARVDPISGNLSKFVINIDQSTGTPALAQTNAFYEDGQGIFWLGTEHGFARLEFTNDTSSPEVTWYKNIPENSNSLSYNYVSWFMDDPVNADYLWICTKGGGLNRMEKSTGTFVHYTTKQGLPNDVVYGILTDKAGNIWGSTNHGLFCMLAGKNAEQPVFRVFSTSDGLQADEFNTNAFGKLSNGHLVFGGVNGLNIFNPQKVLANSFTPNVYITAIQIGNKIVTPGDQTGVLKETIEQTHAITLSYLQDVLTLEFSSLDFTAPGQNKYRYQLIGIDKEWVESGNRRNATYLHLPAGNYVFKVQGSNSQGIWSEHMAELKIQVLPPWWRSWWAYCIYALLVALAIRAYLTFNVNKAKLQSQLNYEQLEAKRVKELDIIKTQLYTNITHEFRTPLTVILGMAQQVKKEPKEHLENGMEMIIRNGESLLKLVNEMLDLSKLESGKMALQLVQGDVITFMRYIVESFQSLAESQKKQLHYLSDLDTLMIAYDPEKIRQIVSNLLSNALKFTPQKGNVYISVSEGKAPAEADELMLVIKVKDTGKGIPEDKLEHIFDRFYQVDTSHTRNSEGTGIGLALTRELVKLMGGEISVKSPPTGSQRGTEFTVWLPVRKAVTPVAEQPLVTTQNTQELPVPIIIENSKIYEKTISQKPLILLVEDNADVVAYTASCLPDYRLAVGKDGLEGFEIATDMVPDLIITDVMMPFVDGFELCRKLKADERTSHIPIIMLTAKAGIESKIEGLEHGADAYLEKPFNKDELLMRIKKLLELRVLLQQFYLKKAGFTEVLSVSTPTVANISVAEPKKTENAFVLKVREAVEARLGEENFTVEQLCKIVFLSHSQLHRKLEALTGCSPNRFIRMIRLTKAKEMLLLPDTSISTIAMECGYNDAGYFSRVFKQEMGVTPNEWRAGMTVSGNTTI